MTQINWNKPIQTYDGHPARLLGKVAHNYPMVVAFGGETDNTETIIQCSEDGISRYSDMPYIINVPITCYAWINIYKDPSKVYPLSLSKPFGSKEEADAARYTERFACIRIAFKEGDGVK